MYLSIGELLERDGDTFTSSSHGLKLVSIKISKPKTSKQEVLYLVPEAILVTIGFSTESTVLIITSFMRSKV